MEKAVSNEVDERVIVAHADLITAYSCPARRQMG
jgi:hypothetical protein